MLFGGRELSFGGGHLHAVACVSRRTTIYAVRRSSLPYDTQFVPPAPRSVAPRTIVYVLLSGVMTWRSPEQPMIAPWLFSMPKSLLDGSDGHRGRTFENHGSPLDVLTIEVDEPPRASDLVRIPVSDDAWSDLRAVHAGLLEGPDRHAREGHVRRLFDTLLAHGAITTAAFDTPSATPSFGRAWDAVATAWAKGALPSLTEVATLAGTSTRQIQRDLGAMVDALAVGTTMGWREATLLFRLKLAVTLLGAPQASIHDVAKAVGYGSSVALARAFRDAGITKSPSQVRDALLGIA